MAESQRDQNELQDIDIEDKTIKFIKNVIYKNCKRWKSFYSGDNQRRWLDDIKWYKGQQFPVNRPKDKATIVNNILFSTIQRELPFMTDSIPRIFIQPEEPSDEVAAKIFERIIQKGWNDRYMPIKVAETTLHTKQLGTGFYHVFWNPELAQGLGDFDCEVVDPLEMFPFPYTRELDTTEGIIWARKRSLRWVRMNYEKGQDVKADKTPDNFIPDRAKDTNSGTDQTIRQITDAQKDSDPSDLTTYYLPSTGSRIDSESLNQVLVITCIIKDDAMEEIEMEADEAEGKERKKNKKEVAKYPNGRVITIAGNVVLQDEPFQFENYPGFIEQLNYINPGEFWGESDITPIKSVQKAINRLLSTTIDAVNRGVYTTKFIDSKSGIDVDTYMTTMDAVYETQVPNPVYEVNNQFLPPQVFAFNNELVRISGSVSGSGELSLPANSQLPSGRALQEFQETQQTRLRQKIRNLEIAIQKIAKAWIEMILKNYTEARIMRLNNADSGAEEFIFVFREENPEIAQEIKQQMSQMEVEGTQQMDPNTGQPVPGSGQKKYQHVLNMADIKAGFDINVATNSTVSLSRLATLDRAIPLFDRGTIDQRALLEAADYPNMEGIMKRMSIAAQQRSQAQQQMQQMAMQLEQGKIQVKAQGDQIKAQTDLVTNKNDNETRLQIEGIKQVGKGEDRLAKINQAIYGGKNATSKN